MIESFQSPAAQALSGNAVLRRFLETEIKEIRIFICDDKKQM
jgi:hypothetical protein